MLLAFDIGNSHIKFGGYCGDDEIFVASIATDDRKTSEQYAYELTNIFTLYQFDREQVEQLLLCSVVPTVTPIIEQALHFLFRLPVRILTAGTKTGLNIKLEHPRALGSDFVANAAWAAKQGKLPCLVVDCGTVTTFTALDDKGTLVGTSIAAGLKLSLDAIRHGAVQLPSVPLLAPQHGVLGRNTADAMKSGAIYGAAGMIDGLLDRLSQALGGAVTVWLTGGSGHIVSPHLRTSHTYVSHITLRGIDVIGQRNHNHMPK